MEAVGWWDDWKTFGVLPFGSSDILGEPMFVYQTLRLCEIVSRQVQIAMDRDQ